MRESLHERDRKWGEIEKEVTKKLNEKGE